MLGFPENTEIVEILYSQVIGVNICIVIDQLLPHSECFIVLSEVT